MKYLAYILVPLVLLLGYWVFFASSDSPSADDADNGAAAATQPSGQAVKYWTSSGLEPDTCVAAWLLTRLVTPGAGVEFTEHGEGAGFDMPGCELSRQPGKATSEVVLDKFKLEDPFAVAVVAVVRELELAPWTVNEDAFFVKVRFGLADAVNYSKSREECLAYALQFLDELRRSFEAKNAAQPSPSNP